MDVNHNLLALVFTCCVSRGLTDNHTDIQFSKVIQPGVRTMWNWTMVKSAVKMLTDYSVHGRMQSLVKAFSDQDVSTPCNEAMAHAFFSLRKFADWMIEMLDASGKVPSGILDGTVMDFGSYDECLKIRVNASAYQELFRGQYCMVGYRSPLFAPLTKPSEIFAYVETYGNPPIWIADPMKKAGGFMKGLGFWFGTCVPSSCTKHDVWKVATAVAEPLGFRAEVADCQVDKKRVWQDHEIAAVTVICVLAAFAIIGTAIDAISRFSARDSDTIPKAFTQESFALRCCKGFSLIANTERLLKTNSGLSLFHGIRFFSATWIILGHTYFYRDRWQFIKYRHLIGVTEKFDKHLPAAVIENFTIPVGSFFFLSGFLITYTNWTKLDRSHGSFNVPKFFLHKFFRIAPALMVTIVLFLAMPLIDSGPLWYTTLDPEIEVCKRTWWRNLLFISNLWDLDDVCLIHTWYLAALMQFHIVGVVLLLISYRWIFVGIAIGLLLLAACCTITALKVVWNDFPMPAMGMVRDMELIEDYNSRIYIKPYAHFASYAIGMVFGVIVLKYRHYKPSGMYQAIGWLLAVSCALLTVYGIYGPAHHVEVRAVYISLHRIGWVLSLGWLTFVCAAGCGGFVNRFLSWKALQPLGNLSYLAYLLHPLVFMYRDASLKERVYYGHTELVFQFLANVVVAYFLAYLCYIVVELPFSLLEVAATSTIKTTTFRNGYPTKDSSNIATISVKPCRGP